MATSWFAQFYQPNGQTEILPGTTVKVIGRQGLTLLVMPVDGEDIQAQVFVGDLPESNQNGHTGFRRQVLCSAIC
jgi:hypothetical protein